METCELIRSGQNFKMSNTLVYLSKFDFNPHWGATVAVDSQSCFTTVYNSSRECSSICQPYKSRKGFIIDWHSVVTQLLLKINSWDRNECSFKSSRISTRLKAAGPLRFWTNGTFFFLSTFVVCHLCGVHKTTPDKVETERRKTIQKAKRPLIKSTHLQIDGQDSGDGRVELSHWTL